jgi:LuxR family transcriptional regulator, maltose regulon positive regulatory protein
MAEEKSFEISGLIATKLNPPQIRTALVHRKRLFEKLDSSPAKLILVTAPAGFGKSTLVSDWLLGKGGKFGWLSLDEGDNDIRRFFSYLLAAFRSAGNDIGLKVAPFLKSRTLPPSDQLLTYLINDLARNGEEFQLVLDDYYFIEEQFIHSAVNFFLDHMPPNIRLIVSTRIDPMLPVHRMRVRNELIEIRERDLRFTQDETKAFFEQSMNLYLDESSISALTERTEGWIAGLQMAAISLHDMYDSQSFIDSFAGSNRYIVDYLLEEVIKHQNTYLQRFLLETSVLPRFNADLCDTVTGRSDSLEILETLERLHLFLVPLDHKREWYRYHHLFAELLQHRLKHTEPSLFDILHERACRWYEARGDYVMAIGYALKMRNLRRAVELFDMNSVNYLRRSELSEFINTEKKIPEELITHYPGILVSKAWALLLSHQLSDPGPLLMQAEKCLEDPPEYYTDDVIAVIRGQIYVLGSFVHRLHGRLKLAIETSEKALTELKSDRDLERGLLHFNLSRAYMKLGYAGKALHYLESCLEENRRAENYYVLLAVLAHIGYLYAVTESLYTARRKLEEAIRYAEQNNLDGLPAAGYIYYQFGRVLYQLNDLEYAGEMLDRALELGISGMEPDIICNAHVIKAWVYAAENLPEAAAGHIRHAVDFLQRTNMKIFEVDLPTEQIYLALLLGNLGEVDTWVRNLKLDSEKEFTVINEQQMIIAIRYYIRTESYDDATSMTDLLYRWADERGRNAVRLMAETFRTLIQYKTGLISFGVESIAEILDRASKGGYIRGLLNLMSDLKPLISEIQYNTDLNPETRTFAENLIQLADRTTGLKEVPKVPKFAQRLTEPLTEREQEVLYYLSMDYSNKEIAGKMFISLDTVKTHLKNLYGKLGANSRKEAVENAKRTKILLRDKGYTG